MIKTHLSYPNQVTSAQKSRRLYKRQQEIRYLVSKLNNSGNVKLQKLMFLANLKQDVCAYDFVPYKYGPYSFILQKDLDYLTRNGFLCFKQNHYQINDADAIDVTSQRKMVLNDIISRYGIFTTQELIQYVYREYPQFAIKSCIADSILSAAEMNNVQKEKPNNEKPALFTIGYEGRSIDKYLSYLVFAGIKMLIDVRANAISMKPEFSERNLSNFCKLMDIEYVHIPELGISSEQRKKIKDKEILFKNYQDVLETNCTDYLDQIVKLALENKRIALTCFEGNPEECHRSIVAKKVYERLSAEFILMNL